MKSKLLPLLVCCLLYAVCLGQWSSPVPLLDGSTSTDGQALVAGAGDTMWATVISTTPPRVLACWTTGDTWSLPVELAPPDSNPVFHDPGMGRDVSGRLWAAWYKDLDSAGVWTAFRDSVGWHASRVYSSGPAAGPMSFASDAAGNWYLGFATLTPYLKGAYSSAVYCRLAGDSWLAPRYVAQGAGSPIETNYSAPLLTPRPDSGIWAAHEMIVWGAAISMLRIVEADTARLCWSENGTDPAVTVDSAGRLWVLYSQLAMYWLWTQVFVDSNSVDTMQITGMAGGRACVTTDPEGWVWATWPIWSSQRVVVSYTRGTEWSAPEAASDSNCVPLGIASDTNGRVYVLFKATDGKLYSVYRTSRPGVLEQPTHALAGLRLPTVVRDVLFLPQDMTEIRSGISDRVPRPSLLDATGRQVMALRSGANDVSRLSPGVYFVRAESRKLSAVSCHKVVVAR